MTPRIELRPYGDAGLLVGIVDEDYEARWNATQTLAAALQRQRPAWLVDLVATYDHVFVTFDPALGDHEGVEALMRRLFGEVRSGSAVAATVQAGRTFEVPVLFGGDAGPDLGDVAVELDLSVDELVGRLTATPWKLRFVASPVGTPFTDRADWDAAVPRMRVPRVAVTPGSVALSGAQSIIYPVRSPGGWRLVGRTPLRLLSADPGSTSLVAYGPGDLLQYVAIDRDRFEELTSEHAGLGDPP